jgi:hypothetical protein
LLGSCTGREYAEEEEEAAEQQPHPQQPHQQHQQPHQQQPHPPTSSLGPRRSLHTSVRIIRTNVASCTPRRTALTMLRAPFMLLESSTVGSTHVYGLHGYRAAPLLPSHHPLAPPLARWTALCGQKKTHTHTHCGTFTLESVRVSGMDTEPPRKAARHTGPRCGRLGTLDQVLHDAGAVPPGHQPCEPNEVYPGYWHPAAFSVAEHWRASSCSIGAGDAIDTFTRIDCPCCASPADVLNRELLPALASLPCSYALCGFEARSELRISAMVDRCLRVLARVRIYSVPRPADDAATAWLCIVYSRVAGDHEASHQFFARLQSVVLGARRDRLELALRSRSAVRHIGSAAAALPAPLAPLAPLAPRSMLNGNSAAEAACRLVQRGRCLTPQEAATLPFPQLAAALALHDPHGTGEHWAEGALRSPLTQIFTCVAVFMGDGLSAASKLGPACACVSPSAPDDGLGPGGHSGAAGEWREQPPARAGPEVLDAAAKCLVPSMLRYIGRCYDDVEGSRALINSLGKVLSALVDAGYPILPLLGRAHDRRPEVVLAAVGDLLWGLTRLSRGGGGGGAGAGSTETCPTRTTVEPGADCCLFLKRAVDSVLRDLARALAARSELQPTRAGPGAE